MKLPLNFSTMTVKTRLLLAFGFVLGVLILLNLIALYQMHSLFDAREKVVSFKVDTVQGNDPFDRIQIAQEWRDLVNQNARRALELFLIQSQENPNTERFSKVYLEQKQTTQTITEIHQKLEKLSQLPDEKKLLKKITDARMRYVNLRNEVELLLPQGRRAEALTALQKDILPLLTEYLNSFNDFIQYEQELAIKNENSLVARYQFVRDMLILFLFVVTVCAGMIATHVYRHITRSLSVIREAMTRMDEKDFNDEIKLPSKDEFARLADTFHTLRNRLKENRLQLLAYQRDLENRVKQRTLELSSTNQELQDSNQLLEQTNAKLASTHKQLLQTEKMASLGQLATGVAQEVSKPVSTIYAHLKSLEEYFSNLFSVLRVYEKQETSISDGALLTELRSAKEEAELELIRKSVPGLLREARDGILQIKDVIQNLKDLSSHDQKSGWHNVNVNVILDATLKVLNQEIYNIAEIKKDYGQVADIDCVVAQINQVLMNILLNAVQSFDGRRGEIRLRTFQIGTQVCVEISDNGPGIPKENLSKIFEPFFSTKTSDKGAGLGLSIAYGIIQAHHGKIEVDSQLGQGTRFTITLPTQQEKTTLAH